MAATTAKVPTTTTGATAPHSPYSPHRVLPAPLERDLPRRNTTPAPASSPACAAFIAPASPRTPTRTTTHETSRAGGTLRARARTDPSPRTSPCTYVAQLPEHPAAHDAERAREMEIQRRRGHARKSSAYAALAALSGLPGAPSYPSGHHPGGYIHARPLQASSPTHGPSNNSQTSTPGSTPPLSADVRDDTSEEEEGIYESHGRRTKSGRLLTPPATPPRHSLVMVAAGCGGSEDDHSPRADLSEYSHHHHLCAHGHGGGEGHARPAFNARKASAQCRQLEGYVSFAAVEGLGEPPSPGPSVGEEEDDESPERSRKRGSLGSGIVGLWRGTFW